MTDTDTLTRPEAPTVQPSPAPPGPGEGARRAHIVRKADQLRGYIEGEEIRALCGYRWVPSADPERFPLCGRCAELRFRQLDAAQDGGA